MLAWDDLRILLAVGRRGSFVAAARGLGIDPTTVGRRLAALEAAVGVAMFERRPEGLLPTEVGAVLLRRAERIEEEIFAADREIGGHDPRPTGPVRITAGDAMINEVLLPALGELRRECPGLVVELRADTRALDLSRREADVAVRLSRPKEAGLVARRLGAVPFGLYASARYLARRGSPRNAADLAAHEFIGYDAALDGLPQVRWLRRTVKPLAYAVRANTTTTQLLACSAGLGIGLFGTHFVAHLPALVPVLPSLRPPPRDAWLTYHRDLRGNARVAAVARWLATLQL